VLQRVVVFTLYIFITPSLVLTFTALSSWNPSITACIDTFNDDM
jgi:hypothetical protein